MEKNETIPVPEDSGSSGLQKEPSAQQNLVTAQPFSGHAITEAVEGIVESNTCTLGGEVGSALIVASMQQMSHDKNQLQQENNKLNQNFQQQQVKLEEARTRSAVLEERLKGYGKNKHLRNLGIAIGIGLVGIGINLGRQKVDIVAISAIVAGSLLTIISWFSGPDGNIK